MSLAVVVVWRPFCVSTLTAATRNCNSGSTAFKSEDFPTPLCPATTLALPGQPASQSIDPLSRGGRQQQHVVSHLGVHAHQRL